LPPHAAIPELNLTDWQQLKTLSQKERDLILKVSVFPSMPGARGAFFWAAFVAGGLERGGGPGDFPAFKFAVRFARYEKPRLVEAEWFDFEKNQTVPMKGRARLCRIIFLSAARATRRVRNWAACWRQFCPADKKSSTG